MTEKAQNGKMIIKPPAEIDITGQSDSTDPFNDWIHKSVNDGDTIDLTGCSLRLEYGLAIGSPGHQYSHPSLPSRERSDLSFIGGTILYTGTDQNDDRRKWGTRILHCHGGKNISFQGTKLQGPLTQPKYNPNIEAWHGIVLSGTDGFKFQDGDIIGVPGDFLYTTPLVMQHQPIRQCSNVFINESVFNICGRQAFTINSSNLTTISNNTVKNALRMIVDCEPNSNAEIFDVMIKNNIIYNVNLGFVHASPFSAKIARWTIAGNRIIKGHLTCTIGGNPGYSAGMNISNNISGDSNPYNSIYHKALIHIGHWDGVTITNNTDTGKAANKTLTAIDTSSCTGFINTIENNFSGFAL